MRAAADEQDRTLASWLRFATTIALDRDAAIEYHLGVSLDYEFTWIPPRLVPGEGGGGKNYAPGYVKGPAVDIKAVPHTGHLRRRSAL